MKQQVLSLGGVWFSYGVVLLIMFIAVTGAAVKEVRLAKAALMAPPK
jgi:hypothetical protein